MNDRSSCSPLATMASDFQVRLAPFMLSETQACKVMASARAPDGTAREQLTYAIAKKPLDWGLPEGVAYRSAFLESAREDLALCLPGKLANAGMFATIPSNCVPRALQIQGQRDKMLVCLGASGIQRLDRPLLEACEIEVGGACRRENHRAHVWHTTALSAFLEKARSSSERKSLSSIAAEMGVVTSGCCHIDEGPIATALSGTTTACFTLKREKDQDAFSVDAMYTPSFIEDVVVVCEGVAWWGPQPFPGHSHSHRVSLRCAVDGVVKIVSLDKVAHAETVSQAAASTTHQMLEMRRLSGDQAPVQPERCPSKKLIAPEFQSLYNGGVRSFQTMRQKDKIVKTPCAWNAWVGALGRSLPFDPNDKTAIDINKESRCPLSMCSSGPVSIFKSCAVFVVTIGDTCYFGPVWGPAATSAERDFAQKLLRCGSRRIQFFGVMKDALDQGSADRTEIARSNIQVSWGLPAGRLGIGAPLITAEEGVGARFLIGDLTYLESQSEPNYWCHNGKRVSWCQAREIVMASSPWLEEQTLSPGEVPSFEMDFHSWNACARLQASKELERGSQQ